MKKIICILSLVFLIACDPADDTVQVDEVTPAEMAGSWTCKEKSFLNGTSTFTVTIAKDASRSNGIVLNNFYHAGTSEEVVATIDNGTINLPKQQFCDNLFSVWGQGTISSNKKIIDWVYYVNTGADIDSVSAQFVR